MPYYEDTIRKMLPKTYLRKHVAEEIYIALTHFKYLEPLMDKYVFNDGTRKDLMSLSGTIPTTYLGESYNIPVCLWLEESYPLTAPICYVKPTRDMMVVRGKYVTGNGEVLLPYMQEWKHGECDLISLLQVMVAEFGESPPVCMKPYPEPEQASCWLQFHREPEVHSAADAADGNSYLGLSTDDDSPHLYQNGETDC